MLNLKIFIIVDFWYMHKLHINRYYHISSE